VVSTCKTFYYAVVRLYNKGYYNYAGVPGVMIRPPSKVLNDVLLFLARYGPSNVSTIARGLEKKQPQISALLSREGVGKHIRKYPGSVTNEQVIWLTDEGCCRALTLGADSERLASHLKKRTNPNDRVLLLAELTSIGGREWASENLTDEVIGNLLDGNPKYQGLPSAKLGFPKDSVKHPEKLLGFLQTFQSHKNFCALWAAGLEEEIRATRYYRALLLGGKGAYRFEVEMMKRESKPLGSKQMPEEVKKMFDKALGPPSLSGQSQDIQGLSKVGTQTPQ
jgi:hypothetical protein